MENLQEKMDKALDLINSDEYILAQKELKEILSNDFQDDIFKEIIEKKYYKIIHSDTFNVDFLLLEKTLKLFNLKNEEKTQLYLNILHILYLELR